MAALFQYLLIYLKLNFRSKQAIIYGYVVPIFFLFAFGSVFRASRPPLLREMGQLLTVTVLGGACFGMPTTMVAERERGVWRRYRLLPTATGGIILSAMVARYLIVLSAALLQIALARLIYGTWLPAHPWQMLLVFTFVCFAFLGLGLVIAMLADNVPAVQALGQAIFLPMIMIGGVGVPLWQLPAWAQKVAGFFPGRYAVDALQACHNGHGISAGRFDLLSLTIIGCAALLAGAKLFRWDAGQRLAPAARGWVALAVVAWAAVGFAADRTGRLKLVQAPAPEPSNAPAVAFNAPAATQPPVALPVSVKTPAAILPATTQSAPDTAPAQVAGAPTTGPASWDQLTDKDIQSITYDDLPDDAGTVTPFAHDLNALDDDGKKRMDNFNDGLGDWPPGQALDVVQRMRNLLSVCAVADIAEDPNESQIPYVVYDYARANIQKDKLIKALAWIALHDGEGTVLTNIKDIKDLGIEAEVPEDQLRERSAAYAKKFLFRLLGKKMATRDQ